MRVLLVHNYYQRRGGEDFVFEGESALLKRRGHEVTTFTLNNKQISERGKFRTAVDSVWNLSVFRRLRRKIAEVDADIVHFHNTFPLVSPAGYYAARAEGCGVVQTLHNYRLFCPKAVLYRDNDVCEDCTYKSFPWPAVVHKCYRGSRPGSMAVGGMLRIHKAIGTWKRRVDAYICLGNFAAQKFASYGLPSSKLYVKPNFVYPDPGPDWSGESFFLFVGRLATEKGVGTLLRAAEEFEGGESFVVVGEGPRKEEVERLAEELERLDWLGYRPSEEVYRLMGKAKAVIVASEWFEGGFPRVGIEAYAKATPVLGSNIGMVREGMEHGRTGRVFESGDYEDLLAQLNRLSSCSSEELKKMRHAAREEFERHYTAGRNYRILRKVYSEVRNKVQNR